MCYLRILILSCLFMSISTNQAQDLSKHTWNQRILILTSDQIDNSLYLQQVEELANKHNELEERKLVVYHVFPQKVLTGIQPPTATFATSSLYKRFKNRNTPYSITLIGLDGGIKLQQSKLLLCKDLFGLIDGMPMRRAEIRKKSRNDRP